MLKNEAIWLGAQAQKVSVDLLSPLLNLGSQGAIYQKDTPCIEHHFLGPLRKRGVKIVNADLQDASGVDLVGDILDQKFVETVSRLGFRSVVCCNLMEHVVNPAAVGFNIANMLLPGGYIFTSCPKIFPYHPDPIDNRYRPTPSDLASLFPNTTIMAESIVLCESGWEYLAHGSRSRAVKIARLAFPFIRPKGWMDTARIAACSLQRFSASCAVLVRDKL
jgi:hypothetical protein